MITPNSLSGEIHNDYKCVNFKHNLVIDMLRLQVNTTLKWMPEDLVDGKSTLV